MATVTHYIYSHYDPARRKALERATGQEPEPSREPEVDPWLTESSFGAQRRVAAAPKFVPAIVSYDETNNMMIAPEALPEPKGEEARDVSGWYRSLTRQARSSSTPPVLTGQLFAMDIPATPHGRPSTQALPVTVTSTVAPAPSASHSPSRKGKEVDRRTKNDWFISRALQSAPVTAPATPSSTLADILAREPPPLPSEKRFAPPVFLALGPTNKGFSMLEQNGWSEGEPLGRGIARRAKRKEPEAPLSQKATSKRFGQEGRASVKEERMEIKIDDDDEISELRDVDVIDLTLSDSDEDDAEGLVEVKEEEVIADTPEQGSEEGDNISSHNPKALITPLPTVLKSDRLGIGLKAKTVGPFKESKKRVTHSAAAIAAHIRTTEEIRQMKKRWGRGTRGHTRMAKAESEQRQRVLANLKS